MSACYKKQYQDRADNALCIYCGKLPQFWGGHTDAVNCTTRTKEGLECEGWLSLSCMPEYELCILCAECGRFHDVLLRVALEEVFETRLVRDVYGANLPPEFRAAISNHECPTTGTELSQQDPAEMLLIAVGKEES